METVKMEIPIGMRWKITKDEMRNQLQTNDKTLFKLQDIEELSGIEYALCIAHDETKDEIIIGLGFSVEEHTIIEADYSISSTKNNFTIKSETFDKPGRMIGENIGTFNEVFDPANNYFIDDNFIVQIEGILRVEKEQPKSANSIAIKSSNNLGEALWNRFDQDFDIEVDGRIVKVHKCVIGTKSPVFDRMFQNCWKESKESKVTIMDFDFDIVELATKFCYSIEITQLLNVSIAIKLLQFSDKYDIADLKYSMEEYLFDQKSPMNIVEIVNASILSNSIKLQEQCFDYMVECSQKKNFVKDLDILDRQFSLKLLKASFSC